MILHQKTKKGSEEYELNISFQAIGSPIVMKNRQNLNISQMPTGNLDYLKFKYRKGIFSKPTFYPNIAIFVSKKGDEYDMVVPIDGQADYNKLSKRVSELGKPVIGGPGENLASSMWHLVFLVLAVSLAIIVDYEYRILENNLINEYIDEYRS